jgi:ceramide glucosyltransferase
MGFIVTLSMLWWALSVAVLVISFLAALALPWLQRRRAVRPDLPPVSAIIPIKFLDADFVACQTSLFEQTYPEFEVLITAAEEQSQVVAAANRLRLMYPTVPSRIVNSDAKIAVSPKLNTLWDAIACARHDLILTKDSNIRLDTNDLKNFVASLGPGVGLVSTIVITTDPENLPALIEASIINGYHARMLMLAAAVGMGFGCGKVMVFRRSDLERAGGLQGLAWALGEDAELAAAMGRLGLRTVLADRISRQVLGSRTLREIWYRQVRWMLIWRLQVPWVFVGEIFSSALPTALAGALAAPAIGFGPFTGAGFTISLWFLLETLLCLSKGWPVSIWSPVAFLGREALIFCARIRACTTDQVVWGGVARKAHRRPGIARAAVRRGMGPRAMDHSK